MIKMKKQNIIPIIALLALVSMMIVPAVAASGGLTYTSLQNGSNIYEGDVWNFVTWGCFLAEQYNALNQEQCHIYGECGVFSVNLTLNRCGTANRIISSGDGGEGVRTFWWQSGQNPAIPVAPVASFSCTPTSQYLNESVVCTDTSTNSPTSWSWLEGINGQPQSGWKTATSRNYTFSESYPALYSVYHSATNTAGTSWYNLTDYISIGYVRSTFVTIDGVSYATIHGTNIMLYDVENGSWSNSTSDADGIFYIDILPYHTINAYATFTIFANHYADASIIGAVTGNSGLDHPIYMFPPGLPPGPGNINLYIPVVDADTTYAIGSVGVQVELPSGAITGDITGPGGDAAVFVVPNNTIIKARASKTGYGPVTELFNSGEVTPKTKTLSMYRLVVTPVPTATPGPGGGTIGPGGTPGPGGTTPVYVDPNDPSLHGGDTSLKAQEMMNWIAMNGMSLVQLCFLVTIMALLGVKLGK